MKEFLVNYRLIVSLHTDLMRQPWKLDLLNSNFRLFHQLSCFQTFSLVHEMNSRSSGLSSFWAIEEIRLSYKELTTDGIPG
jgi:hypothetical protein